MRKIILEEYDINITDINNKKDIIKKTDKEFLKVPFNNFVVSSREQITYEFLKKLDNICEKIDKAEKELLLEEEDYKFLKKYFTSYTNWNPSKNIRKYIIKLGDKIVSAKEILVKEKK